jgi:diguanylate cyclase
MDVKLDKVIKAIEGEIEAFGEVMDVSRFLELKEQLEKFLITDPLTGTLNRWKFESILKREICSAKKLKKPLCLLMIDVDKFKALNDNYGHLGGDNILREISALMEEEAEGTRGKSHHLGRWGGDEFLYIMPLKNVAKSKAIANRIRKRIRNNTTTVSIGVAQLRDGDDVNALIGAADKAMYAAKKKGGNKVEVMQR